ncbi:uncharacterized protein LOC143202987 [Rhynchophorus ferrugineus]|uniref:uncharacterized protein LOC143202987 n=1 Tax=Rhynchophorus ferrugineus TaxID=354439 RepID=UPI003FCC8E30
MDLDFSKICRVCMNKGNMMSLFKVNMFKKMMACASVQVWPNDNLPGQICSKCASKLHISFQFKKQCEKSDLKLRQCLSGIDNEKKISPIQQSNIDQNQPHQVDSQPINQCVYVRDNNKMMEGLVPEQASYDHFMTVQQNDQQMTQLSYDGMASHQIPTQAYTLQTPLIREVYSTPYPTPIQQIQPINIPPPIQTHSLPPPPNLNDKTCDKDTKKDAEDGKVCPTCSKVFKTNVKLNRHMKIHTTVPADLPHKCKVCNKGFSHSGNFKIHMRIHNNERPFKCPVCDRGCRQAQDLEKHMRTHTGERPHKCHICPKAFATSSNLIAHIRTHTGERPYVCCVCQKAFCQSNELTKHMRTHTGEKSHICDICHKGFNGSSSLSTHRRSHTGERPYTCQFCQRGFSSSNCLATHVKKHQQNTLCCNHCDLNFSSVSDFKGHVLAQHNISDPVIFDTSQTNLTNKLQELKCNMCNQTFDKVNDYKNHLKTHSQLQES